MCEIKDEINKVIKEYETYEKNIELTDHEKKLIEYAYIQSTLQRGFDQEAENKTKEKRVVP